MMGDIEECQRVLVDEEQLVLIKVSPSISSSSAQKFPSLPANDDTFFED